MFIIKKYYCLLGRTNRLLFYSNWLTLHLVYEKHFDTIAINQVINNRKGVNEVQIL